MKEYLSSCQIFNIFPYGLSKNIQVVLCKLANIKAGLKEKKNQTKPWSRLDPSTKSSFSIIMNSPSSVQTSMAKVWVLACCLKLLRVYAIVHFLLSVSLGLLVLSQLREQDRYSKICNSQKQKNLGSIFKMSITIKYILESGPYFLFLVCNGGTFYLIIT